MKEVMGKVKRTLSILLSVAMVVTCIPQAGLTAKAAELDAADVVENAAVEDISLTNEDSDVINEDIDVEEDQDTADAESVDSDETETPAEGEEPAEVEEVVDPTIDSAQMTIMEDETEEPEEPVVTTTKKLWPSIDNDKKEMWTLTEVADLTDGEKTYLTVDTIDDSWDGFVGADGTVYSNDGIEQTALENKILAFGVDVKEGYKFASEETGEQVKATLLGQNWSDSSETPIGDSISATYTGGHYEIDLGTAIEASAFDSYDGLGLKVWADVVEKKPELTKEMITLTGDGVTKDDEGNYTVAWKGDGEVKPVVEVKDGDKTLVEDTDYTVVYANNDKAGTATVTVTGKDNYEGTVEITFTINDVRVKLTNTNCTVTVDSEADLKYTGKEIKPAVTVTYTYTDEEGAEKTETLEEGKDYTVAYDKNVDVGKATVIIKGKGDYFTESEDGLEFEEAFEITAADALTALEDTIYADVEADKNGTYDLSALEFKADGKVVTPESYVINQDGTKEGNVLKTGSIEVENGILKYALENGIDLTDENLEDGKIVIDVSFKNYKESSITLTVKAVEKDVLFFKADPDTQVYTSKAIEYAGKITQVSGNDVDAEEVPDSKVEALKDYFTYSYNTDPVGVGTYNVTISLTNHETYKAGNFTTTLEITKAPLTVAAVNKNWTVGSDAPSTTPTASDYAVTGLLGEDALATSPTALKYYRIGENGEKGAEVQDNEWADLTVGTQLIIEVNGATATGNYELTTVDGTLTVKADKSTPITTYDVTLHNYDHNGSNKVIQVDAGHLINEADAETVDAVGYSFKGWYKDEACTKTWNFATETVQGNMDLYAVWATEAKADGEEGVILQIRDIPAQSYTGSQIKPNVQVYDADGNELKKGKDYTIAYKNNTNADTVEAEGGYKGRDGQEGDTKFNADLPYVIITGKGNYAGTKNAQNVIYKNFSIKKADISDVDGNLAAGFTMKYTNQLVAGNKDLKPFTSLKYKKAMTLGTDYSVTIVADNAFSGKDADGNGIALSDDYSKTNDGKKAPAIDKGYYGQFTMIVKGLDGNYTGEVEIPVIVAADSSKLLKNAKINLGKNIKSVDFSSVYFDEVEEAIILPVANYDAESKTYHKVVNGVAEEAAADVKDVFTVSFGKSKNITYLDATKDYDFEFTNNDAVGKATLTITAVEGNENGYVGSVSTTFTIKGLAFKNGKKGTVKVTGLEEPFSYTGKPITPNDMVVTTVKTHTEGEGDDAEEVADKTFVFGQDYTVKYSNNLKIGKKATVTFTANPKSGYTGSFKETFQIGALSLVDSEVIKVYNTGAQNDPQVVQTAAEDEKSATITWETAAEYAVAGSQISYKLVDNQEHELVLGTDYTAKYANNKKVADKSAAKAPTLTITGKGNYSGKLVITFAIVNGNTHSIMASAAATQLNAKKADTYEYKPKVTVKNGAKAVNKKDYEVTYANNKQAAVKEYLNKLAAGEAVSDDEAPHATIKIKNTSSFYTAKPEENETDAETWEATMNTITVPLTIYRDKLTAKNCTINLTANPSEYRYTGEQVTPTVLSVMFDGKDLLASGDVDVAYGANIAAGNNKGTVTVTGLGIYGGSVTKKFKIDTSYIYRPVPAEKTELTAENTKVTLKLDGKELEKDEADKYFATAYYDDEAVEPEVEVAFIDDSGKKPVYITLFRGDSYTVAYGENKAGEGTVTIAAAAGSELYKGSFDVKFDIKARTNNADLAKDFSDKQGKNGWHYGSADWDGANFAELTYNKAEAKYTGANGLALGKDYVHPGDGVDAAYKWIAAENGTIKITGEYVKFANDADENANGVVLRIRHKGAEKLFNDEAKKGGITDKDKVTVAINVDSLEVNKGDEILFQVNPEGNNSYDGGQLSITIESTETSEPTPGPTPDPTPSDKTDIKDYVVVVTKTGETTPMTAEEDGSYNITVDTKPEGSAALDVTLEVKATADATAAVSADNYDVTWENIFADGATTGTGTATITVKESSENYTGSKTVTFNITVSASGPVEGPEEGAE